MGFKQKLKCLCALLIVLLLIAGECDAYKKSSSSRKSSSGRGSSGSSTNTGNSGGSWWSKMTGSGSSSSSSASKVNSATQKKPPEPSAPRLEQNKPIGWNVPGVNNNPGAPPPYSNTHTKGLSNPSGLANPPPYTKNNPPGHQTIHQSNVPNQYQNRPNQYGTANQGMPNQYAGSPNQYQGLNYPRSPGQYPGGAYANQANHYPGMSHGYSGYGAGSHSGYGAAAPSGYFASGYPVTNNYYTQGRSSSGGGTLTNALLAGSLGLGLYNAIRPYPSYSSGYGGMGGYGGASSNGGSTVHHHYYNNQGVGANPNENSNTAQAIPTNQNTNAAQPVGPIQPNPVQPNPVQQNQNTTAALVTPPPPTLAPDNQITDLDCVYAMKILNCSEIPKCPQEWMHPSCLSRTISKEYYDSITLPPPPPMPQAEPELLPTLEKANLPVDQANISQNQTLHSASGQQLPVMSSSTSFVNHSLDLTLFVAVIKLITHFA